MSRPSVKHEVENDLLDALPLKHVLLNIWQLTDSNMSKCGFLGAKYKNT